VDWRGEALVWWERQPPVRRSPLGLTPAAVRISRALRDRPEGLWALRVDGLRITGARPVELPAGMPLHKHLAWTAVELAELPTGRSWRPLNRRRIGSPTLLAGLADPRPLLPHLESLGDLDSALSEARLQGCRDLKWVPTLAALYDLGGRGWEPVVGYLAGRGVEVEGLVRWLEHSIAEHGTQAGPGLALGLLEEAVCGRSAQLQGIVDTLALAGDTWLRGRSVHELLKRIPGLLRLGDLDAEQQLTFVELDLFDAARTLARTHPERLGAFVDLACDWPDEKNRVPLANLVLRSTPRFLAMVVAHCPGPWTQRVEHLNRCVGRDPKRLDRMADRPELLALVKGRPARDVQMILLADEAALLGLPTEPVARGYLDAKRVPSLDGRAMRLAAWLSDGQRGRMPALLAPIVDHGAPHPLDGLEALPLRGRRVVIDACADTALIGRVYSLLRRAATVRRYPAFRTTPRFTEPPDTRRVIDLVELPRRLAAEAEALEQSGRSPVRLASLRARLADMDTLLRERDAALARLRAKAARLHHLRELEDWIEAVARAHFVRGDIDEDHRNAESLLARAPRNRRILRRLLRGVDFRNHPVNRAWCARMRESGLELAPWLHRFVTTHEGFTMRSAKDPLEVLQMGNRFGTCLAVGGENEHSTIANAVEVNKRVLYLEEDGVVVGRKLIGITQERTLIGFYSYGSKRRPEIDHTFTAAAEVLAAQVGVPLADDGDDELGLFAEWYNDDCVAWGRP